MTDTMVYLFPFEKIHYGSRVVIYGAGKVGQCYLQQMQKTGYCTVVCVADQRHLVNYSGEQVSTCSPIDIVNYDFDKVLIAVDDEVVVRGICDYLTDILGIDPANIVCGNGRIFLPKYLHNSLSGLEEGRKEIFAYGHEKLAMAFFVGDGLGDCIIAKRFVDEIVSLAGVDCLVDIYGKEKYVKAVFADRNYVNRIVDPCRMYFQQKQFYDLAVWSIYILEISAFYKQNVIRFSTRLAETISNLQRAIKQYGLHAGVGLHMGIHFSRCKKIGRNAYTSYNVGNVLAIHDSKVSIPMEESWQKKYQDLQLKKYITFNYGWGLNLHDKAYVPAKVWPFEFYEQLANLLKQQYPGLEIVQIGMGNGGKIAGVDRYILNQDIELTKYVLKNSLLHIDCEGGLVHLATQLGTKCAVLFGPTPVHYFGYADNINIVAEACNDCCYLDEDYAQCYRRLDKPACMYSITPKIVMQRIHEYLMRKLKDRG